MLMEKLQKREWSSLRTNAKVGGGDVNVKIVRGATAKFDVLCSPTP